MSVDQQLVTTDPSDTLVGIDPRGTPQPLVSVFLFCRNRVATIGRSAVSVLGQSYQNIEYVVQDGRSTDGTLEQLRQLGDPRVRLRSEPDAGPADAFWRAIRRCRGDYVCACLSDEELLPDAVREAVELLERDREAVAVTRDAYRTNLHGVIIDTVKGEPFDLASYMANRLCPNFAATVFRASALERAGLFSRDWDPDCGEFELWCRLGLLGPVRYLPGAVAKYGLHEGQLSRDPANVVRLVHGRLRVIDRLAAEAPFFRVRPELHRRCRIETALTFARQLTTLGALAAATDVRLLVADESGALPPPRPSARLAADFARMARRVRAAGREQSALDLLESATTLSPVDPHAFYEVGLAHATAGRIDKALAMFEAAVRIDPGFHEAHWQRGLLLERRGRIDDAIAAWRQANLEADAHRHSLFLVANLKSPRATNQSLYDDHRHWAKCHAMSPSFYLDSHRFPDWAPGTRAVVGYACSFWDADTITFQLLPMLRRHDRSRFKVIAYAHTEPGPLTKAAVDEVVIVGKMSDEEYLSRVRADGVHILVEINGHSPGHWFGAMAARCAPIQISYLNYTSTSGVEAVDYILADPISAPEGSDPYFTERIHRMPRCFFCFTYEGAELPPVGAPPQIEAGVVTFGCFGSGGKINPELLDLWAEILRRTPNSRLFVRNGELTPEDNRRAMVRAFEARGIEADRLMILPGTSRQGVLESYAQVDVSLDTYPYCGGNTIAESLWQGVPVVTLKGPRLSAAYGASLVTASGAPELVASTPDEYVQKAVTLAGDTARLAFYRSNLRRMVKEFGFSDADRFTTDLESTYEGMLVERYRDRRADWSDALQHLAAIATQRDASDAWARQYGRPEYAELNRAVLEMVSRGLGLDNAGEAGESGERWLLGRLASVLAGQARPVVFDVGAHQGELSVEVLRALPNARLVAFEPVRTSFSRLVEALAGTDAVTVPLAVGASTGVLRLHDHGTDAGSVHASAYAGVFDRFYHTMPVPFDVAQTTLDAWCEATGAAEDGIDLLKIDTEGHELAVLKGASNLLARGAIRAVLFEFNYTHLFSRTFFGDFFDVLPGFTFLRLLPNGLLPLSRTDWSGTEVFRYQNVLAIPEARREVLASLVR